MPFPRDYENHDLTTQADSESVIKFASHWSFPSICSLATRRLEPFIAKSTFDRIVLARFYTVQQWTDLALEYICLRAEPLRIN
jgi:hypothetical protein